jgi:hypothetical protein
MQIELFMEPKTPPLKWDAEFGGDTHGFVGLYPPFSIALDGFVKEGPRTHISPEGPRANFNHHEDVDRLATRSTCAQVLIGIRQGLFQAFRDQDGPRARVYANDCDEDVCTSWFLLKHSHLAEQTMNPALNRLVGMEDMLDATAGAFPYPKDLPALQELAWVFQPYRRFRLSGEIDKKDAASYVAVVTDVEHRIMQHIAGKGKTIPLDTRYEKLGGGKEWALIREIGGQARTGAFSDGIRAYVAVRDRPGGGYTYTVGRMSPYFRFDVPKILLMLNQAESAARGGDYGDRWGGGDTIGGSPRTVGSILTPEQVSEVVEKALTET